jgi:glycosyltransferase involved in cell wall biosynthesis
MSHAPCAEPVRVLAVGEFDAHHDHVGLLDVFAGILRWHPRARMLVVGDGPTRPAIERRMAQLHLVDAVGLVGRLERAALVEVMQRADVFVSPASAGGMDRLPAELALALAGGLCVVAPDLGGISRLVTDGVEGLLVDPGDEGGLTRALNLVIANADLRRRLGEAAAASVRGERRIPA